MEGQGCAGAWAWDCWVTESRSPRRALDFLKKRRRESQTTRKT